MFGTQFGRPTSQGTAGVFQYDRKGTVRKALRQAWELDDADKAERLIRNLARRLEQQAPGGQGF